MVKITDTILRDAHQSLIATRMKTEDMTPALEKIDRVGYHSIEMWGGATFDSCMRFLDEDPWERLRIIRQNAPKTKLQMLLRGQNLVGYRHYADDVVGKFVEKAAENGIDIFRVFDALNDPRNLRTALKSVRKSGKHAQATISYTISPLHSNDVFVALGEELKGMDADSICIKDMAGLIAPYDAYELVSRLKKEVGLPVQLHCHCTSGMAEMAYLKAIEAGADVIDTAISAFAGGTSQPSTESFVAALKGTKYDTGLDLNLISEVAEHFNSIRGKYAQFESKFTGVDPNVLKFQIPGGMISNLANQLKEANALDKMDAVLAEVPRVRKDFGYPPLVTPSSQIVGTQAVLNVIGGERYKMTSKETKDYLAGRYGKPAGEIDAEVRKTVIGDEKPITVRPADLIEPEWQKLVKEAGKLAHGDEDVLLYALFPKVAQEFFARRDAKLNPPKPVEPVSGRYTITVGKNTYEIGIVEAGAYVAVQAAPPVVQTAQATAAPPVPAQSPQAAAGGQATSGNLVKAPLPGKVLRIATRVGAQVKRGSPLVVLEAMKMENEVASPFDGVVKSVNVSEGSSVGAGETLVVIG
ncbi:MAG: oxaloacetate decarboxylase subunit alpha [Thermoplasmata archaeon HGW-Thermoplasmata-1]|nr:MAG: oxaloacetate decarboxylase subunit alpha [Thermoplasmata archaeon HGW-Thermoplasmata-1]